MAKDAQKAPDEKKNEGEAKPKGVKAILAKLPDFKAILKDKKKLMIIAPVALLVVGGGGAAALGVFSSKPAAVEEKKEGEAAHADGEKPAEGGHGEKKADSGGHGEKKADAGGHGGGGHGGGGHGGGEKSAAKVASAYKAAFLDMQDMTINIASNDGRSRYVKIAATLEFGSAETAAIIEPIMPRIQDTFQTYLRELRASDLDGSAGVYRLKEELTRRVNVATHPHKVTGILFREIVVQ